MKVLLIGGGGREHALAWRLRTDSAAVEIVAAPGNPGIAAHARCVPVSATDIEGLIALAMHERPDYTLVGPEAPLSLGIVDRFRAAGFPIFGPTQAAAEIETSKAFAKQLMIDAGVPTAAASRHTDVVSAKRAASAMGAPLVIKASGLAAGKGVIICQTIAEAERAIDYMLRDQGFGAAGTEILVEEFMQGEEISAFYITDGEHALPLLAAQDHKRLLDGDRGPNTGGMGAYAPVSLGTSSAGDAVLDRIIMPTLAALRERRRPFTGLLYAGLMLTPSGPKVVEFNCRFGDPETQAILPLSSPISHLCAAVARGESIRSLGAPPVPNGASVTTVLAAAGYPDAPRGGDPISLPPVEHEGVHLFHAGTARDATGRLVTAGGRVVAVTAVAPTFAEAQARSAHYAGLVEFAGKQYRTDIGWREVARRLRAGTS